MGETDRRCPTHGRITGLRYCPACASSGQPWTEAQADAADVAMGRKPPSGETDDRIAAIRAALLHAAASNQRSSESTLHEAADLLATQADDLEALRREIAEAREACPIVRRQDYFDASLLTAVNETVSQLFQWQSQAEALRRERGTAWKRVEQFEALCESNAEMQTADADKWYRKAEAAEAEVARLREILKTAPGARCLVLVDERKELRAENARLREALDGIASRGHVRDGQRERPPLIVALERWNECIAIAKSALSSSSAGKGE